MSSLVLEEVASVETPLSTKHALFIDSVDGHLKRINSSGIIYDTEHMQARLSSNYTNGSQSYSNITGLSVTLAAGVSYLFTLSLFAQLVTTTDGVSIDFDGGTATATTFRAHCVINDLSSTVMTVAHSTALATDMYTIDMAGSALITISGFITVNVGGTFILRTAKVNDDAGANLTIYTGSSIELRKIT